MADPTKNVRTQFESKMLAPSNSALSSASTSPTKSKVVRSQRITMVSPSPTTDIPEEDPSDEAPPIPRSHTPGHLASKSQSAAAAAVNRRKASESSMRHRSQSASQASTSTLKQQSPLVASNISTYVAASHLVPGSATASNGDSENPPFEKRDSTATDVSRDTIVTSSTSTMITKTGSQQLEVRRPTGMRSTSAIASKVPSAMRSHHRQTSATAIISSRESGGTHHRLYGPQNKKEPYTAFPPLQTQKNAPDVPHAPTSGMYWSRAPVSGTGHTSLRAHTVTLVGSNVYIFGGCDSRACFNELYVLDADSFHWSMPPVVGDIPVPLRAMTCTAVGKRLVIFGGGDGPAYYNEVYVLDTTNFRWSKPKISNEKSPSKRRAHTACLYKNGVYVFGGGDGIRALNDIWRLDVSDPNKMSWRMINGPSYGNSKSSGNTKSTDPTRPRARGYHTANMVGSKLIIFGGSDGGECFNDVWVYDVDTNLWRTVDISMSFRRLSHTATIVGSYLFVIGGHDGNEYSNDVLLLNLVTMTWDKRRIYGLPPSGRGYHGAVLYDSRILVIGGFDGSEVFGDVWILELAVHSYYSQISHFTIEV